MFNRSLNDITELLSDSHRLLDIKIDKETGNVETRPFGLVESLFISGLAVLLITKFAESFVGELGKIAAQKVGGKVDKTMQRLDRKLKSLNRSASQKKIVHISEEDLKNVEEVVQSPELPLNKFSDNELEMACVAARESIATILKSQGIPVQRTEVLSSQITIIIRRDIVQHRDQSSTL